MTEIQTDAIEQATKAHAERLEKELRGAYRAGFNYVYVGRDRSATTAFRTIVFPSYSEMKPKELVDDADRYVWEQYDLDIPARKFRAFMRQSGTT